jgi:hypothetical protein
VNEQAYVMVPAPSVSRAPAEIWTHVLGDTIGAILLPAYVTGTWRRGAQAVGFEACDTSKAGKETTRRGHCCAAVVVRMRLEP